MYATIVFVKILINGTINFSVFFFSGEYLINSRKLQYFNSFCRVKTSNLKTAVTTGPAETEKYYDIPLKLQLYEKSTDPDYELPTSTSTGEYDNPLESPQISSNPAYGVSLSKSNDGEQKPHVSSNPAYGVGLSSTNSKKQLHVSSNPAYGVTLSKSNNGEQQPHVSSNPAYGVGLSKSTNGKEQLHVSSNPAYGVTLSKSNDGEQQPHVSSNPAYGSNLSTYKFATEENDIEQPQMDSNPSYRLTTR